jgi:hypothetical protein
MDDREPYLRVVDDQVWIVTHWHWVSVDDDTVERVSEKMVNVTDQFDDAIAELMVNERERGDKTGP